MTDFSIHDVMSRMLNDEEFYNIISKFNSILNNINSFIKDNPDEVSENISNKDDIQLAISYIKSDYKVGNVHLQKFDTNTTINDVLEYINDDKPSFKFQLDLKFFTVHVYKSINVDIHNKTPKMLNKKFLYALFKKFGNVTKIIDKSNKFIIVYDNEKSAKDAFYYLDNKAF